MGEVYNKTDVVISRAGATTIAEITACGKPAILIPYPHATHNHQRINAEYLESMGTAEVILEDGLTGDILASKIKSFLYNRERLNEMAKKSAGIYRKDAAIRVVNMCKELTGKSSV